MVEAMDVQYCDVCGSPASHYHEGEIHDGAMVIVYSCAEHACSTCQEW